MDEKKRLYKRLYMRKYREGNKEILIEDSKRRQKRRRKRKKYGIEIKGGKCIKCGYNKNYTALEFHHKHGKDKTSRHLLSFSLKRFLEELEKCDLVCSNCHMEIHHPEEIIT